MAQSKNRDNLVFRVNEQNKNLVQKSKDNFKVDNNKKLKNKTKNNGVTSDRINNHPKLNYDARSKIILISYENVIDEKSVRFKII